MSSLIYTYGVCNWFPDYGGELIQPSEFSEFSEIHPNGKIFQCIGFDGNFLAVKYGDKIFHVKVDVFKVIPNPEFQIGNALTIKGKLRTICDIEWHFSKNEPIYYLAFEGRRSPRRYFTQDLLK